MKEKYVFFYFWDVGLQPKPAKGIVGIGDKNAISGAKWSINEQQFYSMPLEDLTLVFPWPFPEGNDAD